MREIHPVLERLARAIADDSRDSYDNYLPWPVAVSHARAAVQALMEPDENQIKRAIIDTVPPSLGPTDAQHASLMKSYPMIYVAMLAPLVEDQR